MAKKKGIFSTIGSLFRWVIVGLAAVMAFALWQNFNKEDAPVVAEAEPEADAPVEEVVTEADEPVSEVEETVEALAADADEALDAAVAEAEEAVENLQAEAEEAVTTLIENGDATADDVADAASNLAGSAAEQAEDTVAAAGEALSNLADAAQDAAEGTAETGAEGLAAISEDVTEAVEGAIDMAPDFKVVDRVEAEDGIELTTSAGEGDTAIYTVRRVTCDPLMSGMIGEGASPEAIERTETPEMQPVGEDALSSAIAAAACENG